jgi:hypothetical protein
MESVFHPSEEEFTFATNSVGGECAIAGEVTSVAVISAEIRTLVK